MGTVVTRLARDPSPKDAEEPSETRRVAPRDRARGLGYGRMTVTMSFQ